MEEYKNVVPEPVLDALRSSHSLISSDMEAMKQQLKEGLKAHGLEYTRALNEALNEVLVCTG